LSDIMIELDFCRPDARRYVLSLLGDSPPAVAPAMFLAMGVDPLKHGPGIGPHKVIDGRSSQNDAGPL